MALLSYLLFSNHSKQPREKLAAMLWPDVAPKSARASLRQTVFELKKTLPTEPSVIHATKDTVWLDKAMITADVMQVLGALQHGAVEDLTDLRNFDPNAFLNDLDEIGGEFEDWIAGKRRDLSHDFVTMCKAALDAGELDTQTLFEVATVLRRHDEFDEQAVRFLMRYHLGNNEFPAALKIYGDLYDALATEMDAEPSLETQELVVKIKLLGADKSDGAIAGHAAAGQGVTDARVAIMPFEVLGHEEPDKYVVLGLLDEITCRLARLQSIKVISSNSTRNYLGRPQNLGELRRRLDVQYIVVGSIRRRLDRAAINVQIVEADTQNLIDGRIHECAYDNILTLNSGIVESIVNSLLPNVSRAELARTRDHPVGDLGPHLLLMRAREKIFELTREGFEAAGDLLDQAIEAAPYFAPAYATKADWYSIRIWQRWSEDHQSDSRAMEVCARKALTLSGSEPRVMALMGHNRVLMQRHFDEARRMFEEALHLAPNDAEVLAWTVPSLAFMGEPDQAIFNGTRALDLSPQDPFLFRMHHFLSIAHYTAGNHRLSVDHGLLCYNENPNYLSNIRMTVAAMHAAGRRDEIAPLLKRHNAIATEFDRANYGAGPPFRDPKVRSALISDLRAAGLPV